MSWKMSYGHFYFKRRTKQKNNKINSTQSLATDATGPMAMGHLKRETKEDQEASESESIWISSLDVFNSNDE